MKKISILLVLGLLIAQISNAQIWSALPDTLNKPTTSAIKTANREALFAGTFTGTTSGINSQLCIRYSTATNEFLSVSGFDTLTDVINGFFFRNGTFCAYGKFKKNGLYYGVMKFDANNASASPEAHFQFKGAFAPFGKIMCAGVDDQNNTLIFGDTLANMGPSGMGVNLMAAKVARVSSSGTVTALPTLKPNHASETASIMTFGWNDGTWKILGNFDQLGGNTCFDFGTFDGTTMSPVNTSATANLYCRGYSGGFLGWNGTTTTSGITSPGALFFNGNTLEGLGNGWNMNTLSISGVASNVWYCGAYKNSSGSRVATWNQNSNVWQNRQGNLIPSGNTTDVVRGVVAFAGDTMICFGQLTNFAGMAMTVVANPPLPVELTLFGSQVLENSTIQLYWTTETESNNYGFYVEHSADGINWKNLGFVTGNGSTKVEHDYSFTDTAPVTGVNYYRLKQTDLNGNFEYSTIISETLPTDGDFLLYPNPATTRLEFDFGENTAKSIKISIFDVAGKIVLQRSYEEAMTISLDLREIKLGVYTVVIEHDGKKTTKPLIKTSGW